MQRRQFLKSAGMAALACGLFSACAEKERRPNVLLILTDDQGFGDISSHNNPAVNTPTMDRIAAEGARFDRFYVSPVCAPTRAGVLTGRYHLRTGVHGVTRGKETMRSDEVTIAEILQQHGYATGAFGKWHNGAHYPQHPNGQGFDEFVGFCAGHWNNYFDTELEENGRPIMSSGYITDYCTDRAIDFIKTHQAEPFFCYVPYNPPHSPFQAPDAYFNKYKAKGLDDKLACVYAMCENIDDNIARLLNTLDALEVADDTIVFFITDNGPNGSRYNGNMRGAKGSPHEGGSRVPCFIRWPNGIQAGTVIEPITAHIDLLPTVVDLLRLPKPETLPLDGVSLAPLLDNPNVDWPDRIIFGHWGWAGSARSQTHRLVVKGDDVELYDMINDPEETTNIAELKSKLLETMKSAYDDWWRDVTARGFEPIPTEIGHAEHPVVTLPGHEALLRPDIGEGISYQGANGWANDWITNWTDPDAYPEWPVKIVKPGEYELSIDYICSRENVGVEFAVEVGDASVDGLVSEPHNPDPVYSPDRVKRKEVYEKEWKTLYVGRVKVSKGDSLVRIRLKSRPGRRAMDVKNVKIKML